MLTYACDLQLCELVKRLHFFYETVPTSTNDCELAFPIQASSSIFLRQLGFFSLPRPLLSFIYLFSPIRSTLHLSTSLFKVFFILTFQFKFHHAFRSAPLSPAAPLPHWFQLATSDIMKNMMCLLLWMSFCML